VSKHGRPVCQVAASEGFTRDGSPGNQHCTTHSARCALPRIPPELLTCQNQHSKRCSAFGRGKYKLKSKCEEHGAIAL